MSETTRLILQIAVFALPCLSLIGVFLFGIYQEPKHSKKHKRKIKAQN